MYIYIAFINIEFLLLRVRYCRLEPFQHFKYQKSNELNRESLRHNKTNDHVSKARSLASGELKISASDFHTIYLSLIGSINWQLMTLNFNYKTKKKIR